MNKMDIRTLNIADRNYELLLHLFPNAITETIDEDGKTVRAIDSDILRQEISCAVVEGKDERYQFTWPDKNKAIRAANTPINATLRPSKEESVNFETTENLYIEGDNLEVLKILQETYLEKIKLIYIDPPYNTGNDYLYDDDFSISTNEYLAQSGHYDDLGNRLYPNTERNGRFHTDWLNMIYPRLKLARNLLKEDGAIFISIDENEVGNLQKVCDEIYGESNFICQLVWAAGRKNDSKYISVSHEYILCYVKNINYLQENNIVWREKKQGLNDIYTEHELLRKKFGLDYRKISVELKKWYKSLPDAHPSKAHSHYSQVDEKGIYFADNISWPGGGGPKYDVIHPITKKPVKIPSRGWLTNEANMKKWIEEGRVEFGEDENAVPTLKAYLKDREYTVPYSVFYKDGRASSKRLAEMMGEKVFENPKDEEIIERIIEFCGMDEDDIILDFFSGSATTAHATFLANANDAKNRKFILVQIPDVINPEKEKSAKAKKVAQSAIKLLDSIGKPHNICEIGKERIRRAAEKFSNIEIDTGFRVLRLASSNMKEVSNKPTEIKQNALLENVNNIVEGRTAEDLLFQVMLNSGIMLSSKIEKLKILNKEVFSVADGFLMACFDEDVTEDVVKSIAQKKPYYAVFRDCSMATDSVRTNFDQIFASISPETERRVL
ncbi:MAG: site-specific DNA-methyltransferase [Pseudobutyrivibrio sp.]|nr:site-specific DNA-methyltransferase [Pseudobutyrivibrio sp.]